MSVEYVIYARKIDKVKSDNPLDGLNSWDDFDNKCFELDSFGGSWEVAADYMRETFYLDYDEPNVLKIEDVYEFKNELTEALKEKEDLYTSILNGNSSYSTTDFYELEDVLNSVKDNISNLKSGLFLAEMLLHFIKDNYIYVLVSY